jgi:hypothetical protein
VRLILMPAAWPANENPTGTFTLEPLAATGRPSWRKRSVRPETPRP